MASYGGGTNENDNNNGGYDASFSYSGGYQPGGVGGYYNPTPSTPTDPAATLRRRTTDATGAASSADTMDPLNGAGYQRRSPTHKSRTVVKKLDFMFPKVDTEYTVQTERGGVASLVAYGLIAILVLAEVIAWTSSNNATVEHIAVDTSLGKKMRVNLDITFPSLACEDLHIDIMDVAGDSQLDIEDTMVKKRLNRKGMPLGKEEVAETNPHASKQTAKERVMKEELPEDYCGPCYGAHEEEGQCCNTCDELLEAYKKKKWRTDLVTMTAEQCIREGRDRVEPKKLRRGEGCNLQGYFMVNRVGGNFHIAMGEGVERDGRHIHTFNPEESQNFNASHLINHLSFGPEPEGQTKNRNKDKDLTALNGVKKIVTREYGTTGLFQYFIKIVPTTYIGAGRRGRSDVETNRYFYTERFRPLMKEYYEDEDDEDLFGSRDGENPTLQFDDEDGKKAAVQAGHVGGHSHHDHHNVKKNSILPGVFFIFEIYPFEVEISKTTVPFTHLLIRLMATVGGVFTIARWADSFFYSRERRR